MLPRNHPDLIQIVFDDHRLVANAGLLLPATLAQHLGLEELVDYHLDLGSAPGRANTGDKSCQDHRLPLPLITHSAAVTSSLRSPLPCRRHRRLFGLTEEDWVNSKLVNWLPWSVLNTALARQPRPKRTCSEDS